MPSFRKMEVRSTEKRGSLALIVCVNDTATKPRLRFVSVLPRVWMMARGTIDLMVFLLTLGRVPVAMNHMMLMTEPRKNWYVVQVSGNLKTVSTCLLYLQRVQYCFTTTKLAHQLGLQG